MNIYLRENERENIKMFRLLYVISLAKKCVMFVLKRPLDMESIYTKTYTLSSQERASMVSQLYILYKNRKTNDNHIILFKIKFTEKISVYLLT